MARFKVGDVVRYSDGPTALFKITSIIPDPVRTGANVRYYGDHILGGSAAAYDSDCSPATDDDTLRWAIRRGGVTC
jgi:hypothetical protein